MPSSSSTSDGMMKGHWSSLALPHSAVCCLNVLVEERILPHLGHLNFSLPVPVWPLMCDLSLLVLKALCLHIGQTRSPFFIVISANGFSLVGVAVGGAGAGGGGMGPRDSPLESFSMASWACLNCSLTYF